MSYCFGQRQAQAAWPGQQLQQTRQLTSLKGLQIATGSGRCCRATPILAAVMAPQALKTYKASEMSAQDLLDATARPRINFASILSTVGTLLSILHACRTWRQPHAAPT